ncbi:MAG: DUF5665 domain-containing protein [Candidatus Saganbacteria bacterium]|nr:DUF5665 domain-containing protein [Candidatus Saganbacteria bacterium]
MEKDANEKLAEKLDNLAKYFERVNLADLSEYISTAQRRPLKLLFLNFFAGVARGFGIAVGMTFVVAILFYLLRRMIELPIIGAYIAEIVKIVNYHLKEGVQLK